MVRALRKFLADRRGNVAIITALSIMPIAIMIGGSIDLSRMRVEQSRLQSAVDAAVLSAAQLPSNTSQAALETAVDNFVAANYRGQGEIFDTGVERNGGALDVISYVDVPLTFAALLGQDTRRIAARAAAERGGVNLEVALVLDVTGSMDTRSDPFSWWGSTRIDDLRDAANELIDVIVQDTQTPYYSKAAIVPYSQTINPGSRAASVRGSASSDSGTAITNITWQTGTARSISSISRESKAKVTTSGSHGFNNNDIVAIYGAQGMTQANGGPYKVADKTSNSFRLKDSAGHYVSSSGWGNYYGSATVARCARSDCGLTITTQGSHGLANNATVTFDDLGGGASGLNQYAATVTNRTNNSFVATGIAPIGTYSSSNRGRVYCAATDPGSRSCRYFAFTAVDGRQRAFPISNCVTERTGGNAFTDVAPSGSNLLGPSFQPNSGGCPSSEVLTLTSDKSDLHDAIDDLSTGGSTAGHIGIAWGWYMLSPRFNSAMNNDAANYGAPETLKIAVIMTDGEFNTAHNSGVVARNSGVGSGSDADHINQDATNGNAFAQARALCRAMHTAGIRIYTVGFGLEEGSEASSVLNDCASESSFAYLADDGAELNEAFGAIGESISQLRLTR